ncbi:hypothetical protein [Acetobacterium bakii]|uniref:Uncharacterized protein n=1 Tax=Acetobacterium bakii TaxID=52689 RepID=A0A0L6U1P8_9FIRM|nr:hypothetical protein [Acetobacterium bakii]KNZ42429.1 hypothetical protein AKG39_06610 [Acetobacterium bakii]
MSNDLKKGDVVKSPGSDQTMVLDVQGSDALLFTGNQFIRAYGFLMEDDLLGWNFGIYYSSFDQIPKNYENLDFQDIKQDLASMKQTNEREMIKALLVIENHFEGPELLDQIHERFENEGFNLLNEGFDRVHAALTREDDYVLEDDWEPEA